MREWLADLFKFSNLIVMVVIAMNMWFTDRVLDAFVATSVEPAVLIGAFFAFTTGELWMLSSIKKSKVRVGHVDTNTLSDVVKNRFKKTNITNEIVDGIVSEVADGGSQQQI